MGQRLIQPNTNTNRQYYSIKRQNLTKNKYKEEILLYTVKTQSQAKIHPQKNAQTKNRFDGKTVFRLY